MMSDVMQHFIKETSGAFSCHW